MLSGRGLQHRLAFLMAGMGLLCLVVIVSGQEKKPGDPSDKTPTLKALAKNKDAKNKEAKDAKAAGAKPDDADAKREQSNAEESEANEDEDSGSILNMILGSGVTGIIFMVVLGLFSIVAGTVAVERLVKMSADRIIPVSLIEQLDAIVGGGQISRRELLNTCQASESVLASVVDAGAQRFGGRLADVEKAFEDSAAREMAEIQSKIRPLSTIGGIAPLVGLLGTVVGMIVAFHTASQAGLGKAELLAKGIYMALLTTAGGLSVAIPCLMLATSFNSRAEKLFRQMDRHLMRWLPHIAGESATATRSSRDAAGRSTRQKPVVTADEVEATVSKSKPPPKPPKTKPAKSAEPVTSAESAEPAKSPEPSKPVAEKSDVTEKAEVIETKTKEVVSSAEEKTPPVEPGRPASSRSSNNPLMSS